MPGNERKYDDGTGRFTSIDQLWENYYSWSPYHYCRNNPVSYLDPSGLLPGDIFDTEEAAAQDFSNLYNPLGNEMEVEFGTTIYKDGEGFTYQIPVKGKDDKVKIERVSGKDETAYAHTHPQNYWNLFIFKIYHDNDGFSDEDKQISDDNSLNAYVSTHKGNLFQYLFTTKTTKTISDDIPTDGADDSIPYKVDGKVVTKKTEEEIIKGP